MKKISLTAILILVFAGSAFAQNLPRTVTNRATLAGWVRTGTFTFTNKTLTSPTITDPTITGAGTVVLSALEVNGAITLANDESIDNGTDGDFFINFELIGSQYPSTLAEVFIYSDVDNDSISNDDLSNLVLLRSLDEDSTAINNWVTLESKITDATGDSKDSQFAIKTYLADAATTSLTVSGEILTLANGALIDNSTTALLTITEATVDIEGILTATSMSSDGAIDGTTITGTGKLSTLVATEQLRLSYDAANYATWTVAADGALTLVTVDESATEGDINFNPDGYVGVKTAVPTVEFDVTGAGKFSTDLTVTGGDVIGANGNAIDIGETTDGTITFSRDDAGTVTLTTADNDATADLTIVPGGTGNLLLGDAGGTTQIASSDWTVSTAGAMANMASLSFDNAAAITNPNADSLTITEANTKLIGALIVAGDAAAYAKLSTAAGGGTTLDIVSDGTVSFTVNDSTYYGDDLIVNSDFGFNDGLTMSKMDTVCDAGKATVRWAVLTIDGVAYAMIAAADTAEIVN